MIAVARATSAPQTFACEQWVRADIHRAFAFYSDASNLELITPGFLGFQILTPRPIVMHPGTLIRYRLRLFGVPLEWLTRIEDWQPGRSFTDLQLRGPYALWIHEHRFTSRNGGTLVEDRVAYRLPWEPLSAPVRLLIVRPTIERIFGYRREAIARLLG